MCHSFDVCFNYSAMVVTNAGSRPAASPAAHSAASCEPPPPAPHEGRAAETNSRGPAVWSSSMANDLARACLCPCHPCPSALRSRTATDGRLSRSCQKTWPEAGMRAKIWARSHYRRLLVAWARGKLHVGLCCRACRLGNDSRGPACGSRLRRRHPRCQTAWRMAGSPWRIVRRE